MDFNLDLYHELIVALKQNDYRVICFHGYLTSDFNEKKCIIRHDIDRTSKHILHFAEFEQQNGIRATYYFPSKIIRSYPDLIKKIAAFDHEIGYHYNDLSIHYGNPSAAFQSLKDNLDKLRTLVPVTSICMDGKPLQPYDNRKLWVQFNYKELGIFGEIYLDINYNEFAYYTDTGRKWANKNINVRDKVVSNTQFPIYKSTFEIIDAIKNETFPKKAVINIHPEHWTDNAFDWSKKLVWQSIKNVGKYYLIKYRNLKSNG